MGQSKQRQEKEKALDAQLAGVDVARVANAIHKLCHAMSEQMGADCLLQCLITQQVLSRLGCDSRIAVGYAAWRVGPGEGDTLVHVPLPGMDLSHPQQVAFHAWLRIGSHILDVTTSQFTHKAKQLDAQDGGQTTVLWQPDFLLCKTDKVRSLKEVTQGFDAGLFYYKEDDSVAKRILSKPYHLDPEDVDYAWLIYKNPDVHLVGPFTAQRG